MPSAASERVVKVDNFKGLNLRDPRNALDDHQLSDCINYNLGTAGELAKRTGFKTLVSNVGGANSVQMLGYFRTDVFQQFIATSGGEIYRSADAITWTVIAGGPWGTVDFGTQYIDNFFIVRRNGTVIQWDGTTATTIASSPFGSYCRVFKDRLFVLNSYGAGVLASRLYYSNIADFSAAGWPATNYLDVGSGDGDWLIACYNIQDIFMVFKTGASWILYVQGDPTLWTLRSFNSEVGCISKYTVILFEGVLYFCSIRGVFQTDGNTARIISTDISPVFNNVVVSTGSINRASAFVWEDKYVLSLETFAIVPTWNSWSTLTWNDLASTQWAGSGSQITYLAYHIRQKGWTKWLPSVLAPHTFVSVILSSALKGVYSGDRGNNGKVIKFGDANYQDDAVSYEAVAETKEFDFGSPSEMKRGKWLGVRQRGVGLHTFTHAVDGNAKAPVSSTPTLDLLELKLKGPEFFRMWRIRASATHANPVTIFGFDLHLVKSRAVQDSRG